MDFVWKMCFCLFSGTQKRNWRAPPSNLSAGGRKDGGGGVAHILTNLLFRIWFHIKVFIITTFLRCLENKWNNHNQNHSREPQLKIMLSYAPCITSQFTKKTSLRCNGSSNMIYLKVFKENKRFMDIGPTMNKIPWE